MTYNEWREIATANYDTVRSNYNKTVYEEQVDDPESTDKKEVKLTLKQVLDLCEGTIFEEQIRTAIMKCVYCPFDLNSEIGKVMDIYYGLWRKRRGL